MPEGHKTHRLAIDHTESLAGKTLRVTSPQGRFRGDARKVTGRTMDRVEAVGKQMFYHFDGGRIVHVHLGRYGGFRREASPPPKPVGQIRMRMVAPEMTLDLRGPTRCRVIDADERAAVIAKLGPDPLAGGRKSDVRRNLTGSSKPIAALLLDQSLIAGVGNIFRAEMLWEIEMDPMTPGDELSRDGFDRLWRAILSQMRKGLRYGKIVTVTARQAGRPLTELEGKDRFQIYGHPTCPRCGGAIATPDVASRRLYWCPGCQTGR